MKLLLGISFLTFAILSSSAQSIEPNPSKKVAFPIWAYQPLINFFGTEEEVVTQIQKINPTYLTGQQYAGSMMASDGAQKVRDINCKVGGQRGAFAVNIAYLARFLRNHHKGGVGVLAGPGKCTVQGCAGNEFTGYDCIWLCNDNNYAIRLETEWMASYINDILAACASHNPSIFTEVRGQMFDKQNFNILVGARQGLPDPITEVTIGPS